MWKIINKYNTENEIKDIEKFPQGILWKIMKCFLTLKSNEK